MLRTCYLHVGHQCRVRRPAAHVVAGGVQYVPLPDAVTRCLADALHHVVGPSSSSAAVLRVVDATAACAGLLCRLGTAGSLAWVNDVPVGPGLFIIKCLGFPAIALSIHSSLRQTRPLLCPWNKLTVAWKRGSEWSRIWFWRLAGRQPCEQE